MGFRGIMKFVPRMESVGHYELLFKLSPAFPSIWIKYLDELIERVRLIEQRGPFHLGHFFNEVYKFAGEHGLEIWDRARYPEYYGSYVEAEYLIDLEGKRIYSTFFEDDSGEPSFGQKQKGDTEALMSSLFVSKEKFGPMYPNYGHTLIGKSFEPITDPIWQYYLDPSDWLSFYDDGDNYSMLGSAKLKLLHNGTESRICLVCDVELSEYANEISRFGGVHVETLLKI